MVKENLKEHRRRQQPQQISDQPLPIDDAPALQMNPQEKSLLLPPINLYVKRHGHLTVASEKLVNAAVKAKVSDLERSLHSFPLNEKDPTPPGFLVNLMPHQKKGLHMAVWKEDQRSPGSKR